MGLMIGKTGANPTIPICPYCGKGKNEVILTGLAGEKWAKENGRPDGQMPMYVQIEGDVEPCAECKKKGIAIVEMAPDTRKPTGKRWLVTRDYIKRTVKQPLQDQILKKGIAFIDPETAESVGLHAALEQEG
jgi:hypothetical protein